MSFNILIVDDSFVSRAVLRKSIEMADPSVDTIFEVSNGRQALKFLESHPVDMILDDLNIPEMNEQEMICQILMRPDTAHIPIVIISAETGEQRVNALRSRGICHYIQKPINPEKIKIVLSKVRNLCWADKK